MTRQQRGAVLASAIMSVVGAVFVVTNTCELVAGRFAVSDGDRSGVRNARVVTRAADPGEFWRHIIGIYALGLFAMAPAAICVGYAILHKRR